MTHGDQRSLLPTMALAAILTAVLALAGCGGDSDDEAGPEATASATAVPDKSEAPTPSDAPSDAPPTLEADTSSPTPSEAASSEAAPSEEASTEAPSAAVSSQAPLGPADYIPDYGSNPEWDGLADDCFGGDAAACDELYRITPVVAETVYSYEGYSASCGVRFEYQRPADCAGRMGS